MGDMSRMDHTYESRRRSASEDDEAGPSSAKRPRDALAIIKSEFTHPLDVLPQELRNSILASLPPEDLLAFADANADCKAKVREAGLSIRAALIYVVHTQRLFMRRNVYRWGEKRRHRASAQTHEVAGNCQDVDQRRSEALSTFARLLDTRIVSRIEIDITDCRVGELRNFLVLLRTLYRNKQRKFYSVVYIKSSSALHSICTDVEWALLFHRLSCMFPTRELIVELSCACNNSKCNAVGDLIYDSWNSVQASTRLECLTGHVRCSSDLLDGQFPRLRSLVNHQHCHNSTSATTFLYTFQSLLAVLQNWQQDPATRSFAHRSSVQLSYPQVCDHDAFKPFHDYLDQFSKTVRLRGGWDENNYSVRWALRRPSGCYLCCEMDSRGDSVSLSIGSDLQISEWNKLHRVTP